MKDALFKSFQQKIKFVSEKKMKKMKIIYLNFNLNTTSKYISMKSFFTFRNFFSEN